MKWVIFIGIFLMISSNIFADTNGIWIDAEDIKGGIFGSDEGNPQYLFTNDVNFSTTIRVNKKIVTPNIEVNNLTLERICINGNCRNELENIWSKSTSNNIFYTSGRVGIGTNNPLKSFDILQENQGSAYGMTIRSSNDNSYVAGHLWSGTGGFVIDSRDGDLTGSSNLHLRTGGNDRLLIESGTSNVLTIKSNDRIGIGTTNPNYKLDVRGNLGTSGDIVAGNKLKKLGSFSVQEVSNNKVLAKCGRRESFRVSCPAGSYLVAVKCTAARYYASAGGCNVKSYDSTSAVFGSSKTGGSTGRYTRITGHVYCASGDEALTLKDFSYLKSQNYVTGADDGLACSLSGDAGDSTTTINNQLKNLEHII